MQWWWMSSFICLRDKIQAKNEGFFFLFWESAYHYPTIYNYSLFLSYLLLTQTSHALSCLDTFPCVPTSAWDALLRKLSTIEILSTQRLLIPFCFMSVGTWYIPLICAYHTELLWFVRCPSPLLEIPEGNWLFLIYFCIPST